MSFGRFPLTSLKYQLLYYLDIGQINIDKLKEEFQIQVKQQMQKIQSHINAGYKPYAAVEDEVSSALTICARLNFTRENSGQATAYFSIPVLRLIKMAEHADDDGYSQIVYCSEQVVFFPPDA